MNKSEINLKYKIFLGLIAIGLFLALINSFSSRQANEKADSEISWKNISQEQGSFEDGEAEEIRIGEAVFSVEIAKSDAKRYEGLSNREALAGNDGMLFIFPRKGNYSFVMREMNFGLDFIFINGGKVVGIIKNVPSSADREIKWPGQAYDKVLEVHAGTADKLGIKAGDVVEVKK